jgi:hypothetical protein
MMLTPILGAHPLTLRDRRNRQVRQMVGCYERRGRISAGRDSSGKATAEAVIT